MIARRLFDTLSPEGERAKLTVLIFHRVLPEADSLLASEPDAMWFETQMHWMSAWFNVLPLDEAIQRLRNGTLPARPAAITFDDGYADNCDVALPILSRVGVPATFFIATGYLDGGRMWNDTVIEAVRRAKGPILDLTSLDMGCLPINSIEERRQTLGLLLRRLKYLDSSVREKKANDVAGVANIQPSRNLMMTKEQVRTMVSAKMTIGAHTVSHPILSRLSDQEARSEFVKSKLQLEAITGSKVALFAYPNGMPRIDFGARDIDLARDVGFSGAVTTGWGVAKNNCDVYQIPRFTPWDRARLPYALRLMKNMKHRVTVVA